MTVSDGRRIVRDIDRLPVGVDVERLCPRLAPARPGVALAAERNVRLEAVRRPVHLDAAGDDPADELLGAMDAAGPDRGREAVRARIRDRQRLVEVADAVEARNRAEQLGAR